MPTPSVLIVPARLRSTKLYSQIPISGAGDFTVTRATSATRYNVSGTVRSSTSNIARLDYYTSAGVTGCPGLLVEPAATNLTLQSQAFDTTWTLNSITVSTSAHPAFTSPDGFFNARLITNTDDICSCSQEITVASGTSSISVFAKYNNHAIFRIANGLSEDKSAWFDVLAEEVLSVNGGTASIQNYGNGWYRCIYNPTTTDSGLNAFFISIVNDGGETAGSPGQSMYFWGAQFETGGVATSYIPTTTATVTRSADVITVSGAVSGSIGQTEGTIYAEVHINNLTTADFARVVTIMSNSDSNNFFEIEKRSATILRINARLNSSTGITFLAHSAPFVLGANKIAFAYQDGNYAMGFNGVVVTSSQAGMPVGFNQINLGTVTTANTSFLNDRIRAVALYTTRLTNAQLAALTTL